MPDDSTRTVVVALGVGIGVTLAKVGAAVVTGSTAMAAEAAHSLADTGNDLSLFIAQRRSGRPADDQHPLGYGREAYFWALIAALGMFVAGAAFSLREGIEELIHPSATSSFAVAYVVLAISTVFDLVSFRQSAGQSIPKTATGRWRNGVNRWRRGNRGRTNTAFGRQMENIAGFWDGLRSSNPNRGPSPVIDPHNQVNSY